MSTHKHKQALALLKGAYDLHTHTSPSHFPRALNDLELLKEAEEAGMAGVLIKSHYEPTPARAALVNIAHYGNAKAYGGLVLNWPVGGLNPYAAESALKAGSVIIWMPTRDSANSLEYGDMPGDFFSRPGISISNQEGALRPEVYQIFDVVKRYGAHLATGHLSAGEAVMLCRAGRKAGVQMILTHPEWDRTRVPASTQAELAQMGVLIEKNWMNLAERTCTTEEMLASIHAVGAHSIYLSSDRGQVGAEHPVQGMLLFVEFLLDHGFTAREIEWMVRENPSKIVHTNL